MCTRNVTFQPVKGFSVTENTEQLFILRVIDDYFYIHFFLIP